VFSELSDALIGHENLVSFATVASIAFAMLLDRLLGEPSKWHPLVGYGDLVAWLEKRLNTPAVDAPATCSDAKRNNRVYGVIAWLLATAPIGVLVYGAHHAVMSWSSHLAWLMSSVLLYLCIGQRSLLSHADWIYQPLVSGDLDQAREKVGWIVSRETGEMDEYQITSATVESVLENGNDAIYGALFWFVVAGPVGAVLFRMANTLDAMWGYKNPRYFYFGWCAAKLDDVLGYVPARLAAFCYILVTNTREGWRCWRQQAGQCESPNGGVVMTAGAGALKIKIGGPAIYHGQLKQKIFMGTGSKASGEDIARASKLIERASRLWLMSLLLLSFI